MQFHNLAFSYIGLHAVTWAVMEFKLACNNMSTAPHNKTCALVQWLLEALKIDLEIKVGGVLKNSGNSLSNRH